MNFSKKYLPQILSARVYDIIKETPLHYAKNISKSLNNSIYLKREDLQPIFSFKIRGSYNKIVHLSPNEKKNGIIACSSGNHAQGVAYSANKLDIQSTIIMPTSTPSIKIDSVRNLGSTVIMHGDNVDESFEYASILSQKDNLTMIHPFNDPLVIAGQGTIGIEISKQISLDKIDAIFCGVGGGGLISGIAVYIKTIFPHIKIYGVEEQDSAAMTQSLKENSIIELENLGFFADGSAVKKIGDETFEISKQYVDEMITVDVNEICASIRNAYLDTRTIMEPAGILSLAGADKFIRENKVQNKNFITICSGANMDFDRLRFISENYDTTERLLYTQIPEEPGSFIELYNCIYPLDISEFSYRYSNEDKAQILFSIKGNSEQLEDMYQKLERKNFSYKILEEDYLSKMHLRYQIGNKLDTYTELLYRFVFPEKPGALKNFLEALQLKWNISLFHYRNSGNTESSVLVGIQISESDICILEETLDKIGYLYENHTDNFLYNKMLR